MGVTFYMAGYVIRFIYRPRLISKEYNQIAIAMLEVYIIMSRGQQPSKIGYKIYKS